MSGVEAVPASKSRVRWPGHLLGLYAVACGGAAVLGAGVHPEGWAVFTQPLLGVIGLAGGLLALLGDPWWRPLLRLWLLAQVPVLIVDSSGELTRQPGLWFGFTAGSTGTTGTSALRLEGYGVNVAGLLLLALAHWIIARRWYADVPGALWQFQALRLVRTLFVCATFALLGYVGWGWGPLLVARQALLVVHCPLPGADVYAGEHKLGATPLILTHERLVRWGLSRADGPARCDIRPTPLGDGFILSGNRSATNLFLKPPRWCQNHFSTWPSEWGPRGAPGEVVISSNRCFARLICRSQPGYVLTVSGVTPQTCSPGQPVEFAVGVRLTSQIPPARPQTRADSGPPGKLAITFLRGSAVETKEVELPPDRAGAVPGAELKHTFRIPAPQAPGRYRVRLRYVPGGSPGTEPVRAAEAARTYAALEVK